MASRARRYFRERGGALLLGAVVAAGLMVALLAGEAALSTTRFCTSCSTASGSERGLEIRRRSAPTMT